MAISFSELDPPCACPQCQLHEERKFALQVNPAGDIYLATKAELISYLKRRIAGTKGPHPGVAAGNKIRIDELTKEQAALLIYELNEFGKVITKPRK